MLNWNGREDTLECLRSLASVSYRNFEVIVVDNGSNDGSVGAIRSAHPNVRVIENGANLGFAAGCNAGIVDAVNRGVNYVLLLNNDTVVAPDLLDELVNAADNFPDAGVFSAKIYCFSDPLRIWYAGARWMKSDGNFRYLNAGELDDGASLEDVRDTEYASGCAMFFRTATVKQVGMLDASFFLTFEETDWCYRVRKVGYRCLVIPRAKVWHKGSVSFNGDSSPLYLYFYTRNRLLWAERHLNLRDRLPVWRTTVREVLGWCFAPLRKSGKTWKEFYWSSCAWMGHLGRWWRTPGFWAVRLAVRDYLFRRFGDCPQVVRELNRVKV